MIGASPPRKEDQRLLVGAGRFLDDLQRGGMLFLGVVRSLHAHARLVGIEAAPALSAPGVVAVTPMSLDLTSRADPRVVEALLRGSNGTA